MLLELFYFLKLEKWLTCDVKCGILIKSVREIQTKVYRGMEQSGSSSAHNPKVVSSNLAPATKWKRTFKQVKQLEVQV